jgi:hypothetical protein
MLVKWCMLAYDVNWVGDGMLYTDDCLFWKSINYLHYPVEQIIIICYKLKLKFDMQNSCSEECFVFHQNSLLRSPHGTRWSRDHNWGSDNYLKIILDFFILIISAFVLRDSAFGHRDACGGGYSFLTEYKAFLRTIILHVKQYTISHSVYVII